MPPKASTARRRPATPRKKTAIEIVVRRGALKRFDALKSRTGELPVVVTWDRRLDDRRDDVDGDVKRERRYAERRRTPPFTWDLADFVVVEPTKRQKAARAATTRRKRKTRKKS